jgi:hypothetical protein
MSDHFTSSPRIHTFPAYSCWVVFSTGAYMVLWLSSSVSAISRQPRPGYLYLYLFQDVYTYNFPEDRRPIKLLGK